MLRKQTRALSESVTLLKSTFKLQPDFSEALRQILLEYSCKYDPCLFHRQPPSNCTRKVGGPIWSSKITNSHFGLPWKFATLTDSPIWNILSRRFLSVDLLLSSIFVGTLTDKSRYTRSRQNQGCWPLNSITGDYRGYSQQQSEKKFLVQVAKQYVNH